MFLLSLSTFCMSTVNQSRTEPFVDDFYGVDVSIHITTVDFAARRKESTVKGEHLYHRGLRVWRWSSDNRPPKNYVTGIEMRVGNVGYKLPQSLLVGLVDFHGSEPPGTPRFASVWLDETKRSWGAKVRFSDAATSFNAYFTGQIGSARVKRLIEIDGERVESSAGMAIVRKLK